MTIHNRSAEPASGRRLPLRLIVPIPPRASPRACLEAQIDFLLEMLDRIDGDPDLEEGGDLEQACEDEGAQCDDEGYQDPDGDLDSEDEPWFPDTFAGRAERAGVHAASARLRSIVRRRRAEVRP